MFLARGIGVRGLQLLCPRGTAAASGRVTSCIVKLAAAQEDSPTASTDDGPQGRSSSRRGLFRGRRLHDDDDDEPRYQRGQREDGPPSPDALASRRSQLLDIHAQSLRDAGVNEVPRGPQPAGSSRNSSRSFEPRHAPMGRSPERPRGSGGRGSAAGPRGVVPERDGRPRGQFKPPSAVTASADRTWARKKWPVNDDSSDEDEGYEADEAQPAGRAAGARPDVVHGRVKTSLPEELTLRLEDQIRNNAKSIPELPLGQRGVQKELVGSMHLIWRKHEVIKLRLPQKRKMAKKYLPYIKQVVAVVESLSGGVVVWRSGRSMWVFRGVDYKPLEPTEISEKLFGKKERPVTGPLLSSAAPLAGQEVQLPLCGRGYWTGGATALTLPGAPAPAAPNQQQPDASSSASSADAGSSAGQADRDEDGLGSGAGVKGGQQYNSLPWAVLAPPAAGGEQQGTGPKTAILFLHDAYGFGSADSQQHSKQVCDLLAATAGVPVLMPDLLEGSKQTWRGREWPMQKSVMEREQGWLSRNGRGGLTANGPAVRAAAAYLRTQLGVERVAVVGAGWGGWLALHGAINRELFACGVVCSAGCFFGDEERLAPRLQAPLLFLSSKWDPMEKVQLEASDAYADTCAFKRYGNLHPGFWGAQARWGVPAEAASATSALLFAADWVRWLCCGDEAAGGRVKAYLPFGKGTTGKPQGPHAGFPWLPEAQKMEVPTTTKRERRRAREVSHRESNLQKLEEARQAGTGQPLPEELAKVAKRQAKRAERERDEFMAGPGGVGL